MLQLEQNSEFFSISLLLFHLFLTISMRHTIIWIKLDICNHYCLCFFKNFTDILIFCLILGFFIRQQSPQIYIKKKSGYFPILDSLNIPYSKNYIIQII